MNNKDLLSFIYYHPFLSKDDIEIFLNIEKVPIDLLKFQKLEFVSFLTYERVHYYFVTSKGARILNVKSPYKREMREKMKFMLPHYIDTNKFFKTLKIYADKNDIEFSDFISDRFLKIKFSYSGKYFNINPDGFCSFNNENFYVEIDRGTEGSFKILEKVDAYSAFFLSFSYKKYFDKFPKVLFIVPDKKREKLLQERIRIFINSNKYKDEINFFKIFIFTDVEKNPLMISNNL